MVIRSKSGWLVQSVPRMIFAGGIASLLGCSALWYSQSSSTIPVGQALPSTKLSADASKLARLTSLNQSFPGVRNGFFRRFPSPLVLSLRQPSKSVLVTRSSSACTAQTKVRVEGAYAFRVQYSAGIAPRSGSSLAVGIAETGAQKLRLSPGLSYSESVEGMEGTIELSAPTCDGTLTINGVVEEFSVDSGIGVIDTLERPMINSTCQAKPHPNEWYPGVEPRQDLVRILEKAVVRLLITRVDPQLESIQSLCTGTRIQSKRDPNGFYILTANHCLVDGNVNADPGTIQSIEALWDYRTPSCDSTTPRLLTRSERAKLPKSNGRLLASRVQSDSALLQVDPVAGDHPGLEWQFGFSGPNDAITHRLSHPSGKSQAYSRGATDFARTRERCPGLPKSEFFFTAQNIGETAGGSSGSALVTQTGKIIGQQYGICGPPKATVDGDFQQSWAAFRPFLE